MSSCQSRNQNPIQSHRLGPPRPSIHASTSLQMKTSACQVNGPVHCGLRYLLFRVSGFGVQAVDPGGPPHLHLDMQVRNAHSA